MELVKKQISNIFLNQVKKNLILSKYITNIKKLLSIFSKDINYEKEIIFKNDKVELLKVSLSNFENSVFILVKHLNDFFEFFSKIEIKKKIDLNLIFLYKSRREKQNIVNNNYSRKIFFKNIYHLFLSSLKLEVLLKIFFNEKGKNPIFQIRKIKSHIDKLYLSKKRKLYGNDNKNNDEQINNNKNKIISNNYSKPNLNEFSLINITKIVFDYICRNQNNLNELTSQKITNNIVKSFSKNENNESKSFKNIQRRVYDAINVMVASKILKKTKNKKYIFNCKKIVNLNENKNERIDNQIIELEDTIKKKKEKLFSLISNISLYQKFIDLNKNNINRINSLDKLNFPIHLINNVWGSNNNKFEIKSNKKQNKFLFLSDFPINFMNYEEVKKKLSFENEQNLCFNRIQKNIKNNEIINYLKNKGYYNNYYQDLLYDNGNYKKENSDLYEMNKIFDLNFWKYDEEYFKNDTLSTNILTENQNFKNTEDYFISSNI